MGVAATWWMDLILAFVQGITEIFPVSSSAHLVIVSRILGRIMNFNLLLFFHLGTFMAILAHYRRDAWNILAGRLGARLLFFLFLSFVTTGLVGLQFRSLAENLIASQGNMISFMWMVNGVAIIGIGLLSPQGTRRYEELRMWEFILLGLFQGMTAVPGISRLGITLGVGLMLGLIWMDALKVSFLLSLPTILFANLYELILMTGWFSSIGIYSAAGNGITVPLPILPEDVIFGGLSFMVAFASGLLALHILSSHLSRKLLAYFGLYCLAAGLFFIPYLQLL
jgi:undecaprenyl-diphosphatase